MGRAVTQVQVQLAGTHGCVEAEVGTLGPVQQGLQQHYAAVHFRVVQAQGGDHVRPEARHGGGADGMLFRGQLEGRSGRELREGDEQGMVCVEFSEGEAHRRVQILDMAGQGATGVEPGPIRQVSVVGMDVGIEGQVGREAQGLTLRGKRIHPRRGHGPAGPPGCVIGHARIWQVRQDCQVALARLGLEDAPHQGRQFPTAQPVVHGDLLDPRMAEGSGACRAGPSMMEGRWPCPTCSW